MALKVSDSDALFGDLNVPVMPEIKAPQNNVKTDPKSVEKPVGEPAAEPVVPVSPITALLPHAEVKTVAKKHRQNLYFTEEVAKYISFESRRRGLTINRFVENVLVEYMGSDRAFITDAQIMREQGAD